MKTSKANNAHLHHSAPNVNLPLHVDILERLLPKSILPQCLVTPCHGTIRGTRREYPVDAGLAHLVIAFRVNEEPHVWVQVSRGLADGADLWEQLA